MPITPPDNRIPRRRASVFCLDEAQGILTVRLRDPVSGIEQTYLPGGAVEVGEEPAAAAIREALEETGYSVTVIGDASVKRYDFLWSGEMHDCTTHFFLARLVDPTAPPREVSDEPAYHRGVRWLRMGNEDEVRAHFGFHDAIGAALVDLWRRAKKP